MARPIRTGERTGKRPGKAAQAERGFAYAWALMAVMVAGIYLGKVGDIASTSLRHQKEEDLLHTGRDIQLAIEAYYRQADGMGSRYPRRLEDLLRDPRFPFVRRHLRKLHADPLTQSRDWGLILDGEGNITGVYSKAPGVPLKQAEFPEACAQFAGQQSYQGWRFQAVPPAGRGTSLRRR